MNGMTSFKHIVLLTTLLALTACGGGGGGDGGGPTGYILVPANPAVGTTSDFYVAKYEMKCADDATGLACSGAALSQVDNQPWTRVDRPTAIAACQANGAGYDMITNAQWQTIARNIENVASNWSSGIVGTANINYGHMDSNPNQSCDASNENINGDCSNIDGESGFNQKRTHTLSNGEVIWDIAGNVWEWVSDDNTTDYVTDYGVADGFVSQLTEPNVKLLFGPEGDHTFLPNGGLGRIWYGTAGGAFRGGYWEYGVLTGIFALRLTHSASFTTSTLGFRCVYQ